MGDHGLELGRLKRATQVNPITTADYITPSAAVTAGGGEMSSNAEKLSHFRTVEQGQQLLELAAIVGGGVELAGKSSSIKSSSECMKSSNAISSSICFRTFFNSFVLCSERSISISTTGSRRQLSIDKNERKEESDEPEVPLLGEREGSAWLGDMFVGRKQSNQANNTANNGFQQGFAIEPKPPPRRRQIQVLKIGIHSKQPDPKTTPSAIVRLHCSPNWRGLGAAGWPGLGPSAWLGTAARRQGVWLRRSKNPANSTPCGVCFGGWEEGCSWPILQAPAPSVSLCLQALPYLIEGLP